MIGALRIDTDGRTVEEAADLIVARTGWHGRAGPATRWTSVPPESPDGLVDNQGGDVGDAVDLLLRWVSDPGPIAERP